MKKNVHRICDVVMEVGKKIYEDQKRGAPSFTQQLYEEQVARNKILKERNKKWDELIGDKK